jgi:hypothetical protein
VNLNCTVTDEVSYTLTVTPDDTDGITMDTALTIFDQGVDSTIDPRIPVTTTFQRNGELISGTGYEGKRPAVLTTAVVHTLIKLDSDKPPIRAEQYYRNIIAIAPCSGVDTAYDVQQRVKGKALITKKLKLVFEIMLPDSAPVVRTKNCEIVVVSYAKEEEVQ